MKELFLVFECIFWGNCEEWFWNGEDGGIVNGFSKVGIGRKIFQSTCVYGVLLDEFLRGVFMKIVKGITLNYF